MNNGTDQKPTIIDGDKQFALLICYVRDLLRELDLTDSVSHCLVNTAYANSQASQYLKANNINAVMVPTGVKNAHPEVQKYDIGANDEPNGHGTICIKWDKLEAALAEKGKTDHPAAKKLKAFLRISNVYVGDALANLLMVEAVLRDKDISVQQFSEMYSEYPNKMYKAIVSNRTNFKTTWDESRLTQPVELQNFIDSAVNGVDGGSIR